MSALNCRSMLFTILTTDSERVQLPFRKPLSSVSELMTASRVQDMVCPEPLLPVKRDPLSLRSACSQSSRRTPSCSTRLSQAAGALSRYESARPPVLDSTSQTKSACLMVGDTVGGGVGLAGPNVSNHAGFEHSWHDSGHNVLKYGPMLGEAQWLNPELASLHLSVAYPLDASDPFVEIISNS